MTRVWMFLMAAGLAGAQNLPQVLKRGEAVFNDTCSAGYCHGPKGSGGGAPRLAAREFTQAYIANTVMRGVDGTAMAAFGASLPRADLVAVVAYVASLNGIANPSLNIGRGRGGFGAAPPEPALPPEAAHGRELFSDALRGFARCSTCHEVNGIGIPVAAPISKVPESVAALKSLETPRVQTATLDGDSMPALILSNGSRGAIFYDLTTPPPVRRMAESGSVKFASRNGWKHASQMGSYSDSELNAILDYLRAVVKP
jgi:mono/diheme cytochrome c family protein